MAEKGERSREEREEEGGRTGEERGSRGKVGGVEVIGKKGERRGKSGGKGRQFLTAKVDVNSHGLADDTLL